jgi:hypothetical protein
MSIMPPVYNKRKQIRVFMREEKKA